MKLDKNDIAERASRVIRIESEAVKKLLPVDADTYLRALESIVNCKGKVVLTGMGKSGLIAQKISATMASTGTSSFFLHPAEALHGDLGMVSKGDVVIAIGKSGESNELNGLIPGLRRIGTTLIAITAMPDSTLARNADVVILLPFAEEACPHNLAPTSSTTASLVIGDVLAMVAMEIRGFQPSDFAVYHPGGKLGMRLLTKVSDLMVPRSQCGILNVETANMQAVLATLTDYANGIVLFENPDETFCGILTDGDIRRLLQRVGNNFFDLRVGEVLNRTPVQVSSDILAVEALEIMESRTKPLNVLPVIVGGNAKGVLRNHDVIRLK
jgi:arabinose-5-phosphate isomerase